MESRLHMDKLVEALNKNRLEALSDGIFAFAMTLLVLNIEFPENIATSPTHETVSQILWGTFPSVAHFVIAFVVIAGFWITHHKCYDRLKSVDGRLIWLNTFTLLLVALLPFSTDFADTFVSAPISAMVFETNILLTGILMLLQLEYAAGHPHLMQKDVTPGQIGNARRRIIVMPAISLVAILIALMGYTWSTALYLITPLAYRLFSVK